MEVSDSVQFPGLHPERPARRSLLIAAALMAAITAARFAVVSPGEGVGFLYVIPISIVASAYGWRGGAATAAIGFALTVVWGIACEVPLGALGYGVRAATFAIVGCVVGFEVERRRALERERGQLLEKLHRIAMQDELTGLPNRRAWEDRLALELKRAARSNEPLAVAALDLDGLKRVNHTQGRERGDLVLRTCAAAGASAIRSTDFLARVGGDEFAMVLPNCGTAEACEVAERMLERMPAPHSFSIGIAQWNGREESEQLMWRADEALQAAKAGGGNSLASSLEQTTP
jgi:diguanylate cyclase (GGDEF)-like protein